MRRAIAALLCGAAALLADRSVQACTAFCAVGRGQVLVGNNEDWNNPESKITRQDVRMRGVSMQDLASALQGILGRPVIDGDGHPGFLRHGIRVG
jgi:hypothetical protein